MSKIRSKFKTPKTRVIKPKKLRGLAETLRLLNTLYRPIVPHSEWIKTAHPKPSSAINGANA